MERKVRKGASRHELHRGHWLWVHYEFTVTYTDNSNGLGTVVRKNRDLTATLPRCNLEPFVVKRNKEYRLHKEATSSM